MTNENLITSHDSLAEIRETMEKHSPLQAAELCVQGGNKSQPSQNKLSTIPLKIINQKVLDSCTPLSLEAYLMIQKTPEGLTNTVFSSPLRSIHQLQVSKPTSDRQNMMKCALFFKKLIQNCQRAKSTQSGQNDVHPKQFVNVKELISALIFDELSVEDFICGLQDLLKLKSQTQLASFLRKTLPDLRAAITDGEVLIEDIVKFPGSFAAISPQYIQNSDCRVSVQCNHTNFENSNTTRDLSSSQPTTGFSALRQNHIQRHLESHDYITSDENVIHVRRLQDTPLDSAVLKTSELLRKITRRMNETCYVEEEVLTLISDAFEYRLKEMLGELTILAEHRVDLLRLNSSYSIVDDTKRQVEFIQNIDRQQCDSKKYVRADIKVMDGGRNPVKCSNKTNEAALTALSGNKSHRFRWDQACGTSNRFYRKNTVHINICDFQALISHDPRCARSHLLHKLALGGPFTESN